MSENQNKNENAPVASDLVDIECRYLKGERLADLFEEKLQERVSHRVEARRLLDRIGPSPFEIVARESSVKSSVRPNSWLEVARPAAIVVAGMVYNWDDVGSFTRFDGDGKPEIIVFSKTSWFWRHHAFDLIEKRDKAFNGLVATLTNPVLVGR